MNADRDLNPGAAALVRALRPISRWTRKARGRERWVYDECTALELDGWRPDAFPGVLAGEAVSERLRAMIESGRPAMVCRFGTTELGVVAAGLTPLTVGNALRMAAGSNTLRDIGLHHGHVEALCTNSGFFPRGLPGLRRFTALMAACCREIDMLGSWCAQEELLLPLMPGVQRVRFRDLEPYMHERPWSAALRGRRVLVVHPFAETIERQFRERRAQLFANPEVLPPFELQTIKAVQSIAGTPVAFADWFEALASMEQEMSRRDFDVAIVGCGAYGMPLAAHAKRLGRIGIHLGGQTQLLFGIRGKRWEDGHDRIKALFNAHWVLPDSADRPPNFQQVEGGAYW